MFSVSLLPAEPGTFSFPGDCGAIFAWKLTRLTFYFWYLCGIELIWRRPAPEPQRSRTVRIKGEEDSYRALIVSRVLAWILKSSIVLPALSADTNQRGCLPRPDQVSDGIAGF
jgi:hypothetical protein